MKIEMRDGQKQHINKHEIYYSIITCVTSREHNLNNSFSTRTEIF